MLLIYKLFGLIFTLLLLLLLFELSQVCNLLGWGWAVPAIDSSMSGFQEFQQEYWVNQYICMILTKPNLAYFTQFQTETFVLNYLLINLVG